MAPGAQGTVGGTPVKVSSGFVVAGGITRLPRPQLYQPLLVTPLLPLPVEELLLEATPSQLEALQRHSAEQVFLYSQVAASSLSVVAQ